MTHHATQVSSLILMLVSCLREWRTARICPSLSPAVYAHRRSRRLTLWRQWNWWSSTWNTPSRSSSGISSGKVAVSQHSHFDLLFLYLEPPSPLCPSVFLLLFSAVLQSWRSAGWSATSPSRIPPLKWRCVFTVTGWRCWDVVWWSRSCWTQVLIHIQKTHARTYILLRLNPDVLPNPHFGCTFVLLTCSVWILEDITV